MVPKGKKIWLDGKMVNWDNANIHILTYTLHYGLGLFEGIRAYELTDGRSAIFRLQDHIIRLYQSAHIMNIKIPFSPEELEAACKDIMRVNELKHAYIRPLVFVGHGDMGLYAINNRIRTAIAAWPWTNYLGEKSLKKGIRTKVSSYMRHQINSTLTKAKTCANYVNSILAKQEAIQAGYDEAIFLDSQGHVAEASAENIFIVDKGIVKTSPVGNSVLRGITRDSILQILKDEKILYNESLFTRDELYIANEVFLSGTAAEITPVIEVDNRCIGDGNPGPITRKIQKIYFESVLGKNSRHKDWLDAI